MICEDILANATVEEVRTLNRVVMLRDVASVQEALMMLARHKILSAPVVTTVKGQPQEPAAEDGPQFPQEKPAQEILGFVDVRDIINSFLAEVNTEEISNMKMLKRMAFLEEKGAQFAGKRMQDLKVVGGDGTFMHVDDTSKVTLKDLIKDAFLNPSEVRRWKRQTPRADELAGEPQLRRSDSLAPPAVVHRCAVFDSNGKIQNIVSQSDVARYVLNKAKSDDAVRAVFQQSVGQLGLGSCPVVTVTPELCSFEVLSLMHRKHISAVAIVGHKGEIIGNFSLSDMRTFVVEHFGALALPVVEFLALEHGTEYSGYGVAAESTEDVQQIQASQGSQFAASGPVRRRESRPGQEVGQLLVLSTPETTLMEVVELLVENRLHRLYIVNEKNEPVSVITLTDVLRKMLQI